MGLMLFGVQKLTTKELYKKPMFQDRIVLAENSIFGTYCTFQAESNSTKLSLSNFTTTKPRKFSPAAGQGIFIQEFTKYNRVG